MSYFSSGAQLLGKLEHTAAELLETTMQERGRGFASDNESWAEIKAHLERAKKATGDLEKVHKEMWDAIKDQNEDAYGALANELTRGRCAGGGMDGRLSARQDRRGDDGRVKRTWTTSDLSHRRRGRRCAGRARGRAAAARGRHETRRRTRSASSP